MRSMLSMSNFTAIIKQTEDWWIGWVEEIPGVNSQGKTRDELVENLSSALREALEMHRQEAIAAAEGDYQEQALAL
jgi:predicted RNase H-like HicB family nuclease